MSGKLIVTLRIVARPCRLSADASIGPLCRLCRCAATETEWGPRDYRESDEKVLSEWTPHKLSQRSHISLSQETVSIIWLRRAP